jgi:hypothetical protein
MKVKISKIVPSNSESAKKLKGEIINLDEKSFLLSYDKIEEKNYVGYPIYYQIITNLPDPNSDYEHLKLDVAIMLFRSE